MGSTGEATDMLTPYRPPIYLRLLWQGKFKPTLPYAWLLLVVVVRLHDGCLHACWLGLDQHELCDPSKSHLGGREWG